MLVVVPFAIPDFVVSFGWASLSTWVHGFRGAVLVMTLAVYPLVYLPVAASLRSADPDQEEVARSLGLGRVRTFFRVTLGQARGAILGGCVLVALVILAEYGAFEILGYQTFTTEIFTEFQDSFNVPASLRPVARAGAVWVWSCSEATPRPGAGPGRRTGPLAQRVTRRHRLGRATVPVLAGFVALVGPGSRRAGRVERLLDVRGRSPRADRGLASLSAAWHTALYSGVRRRAGHADGPAGGPARRPPSGAPGAHCSSAAPTWCWPCPGW